MSTVNPLAAAAKPVTLGAPLSPPTALGLGQATPAADIINLVPQRELRADLIWGDSGHGKDTNLWFAVYHVATKLGKKSLLLTGESLGTGMQLAQKLGMVDVISIAGTDKPMDLVAGIIKGRKWPIIRHQKSGIIYDFKSQEAIIDPDKYGLIMINSMTSLSSLFQQSMQIEGTVQLPMTPGKDNYNVVIDGVSIVGSAPTHVGFIHDRLYSYVVASTYLPVSKVLWTARQKLGAVGEKKKKDGEIIKAGYPIIGPDVAGGAATSKITSWFGGAYHLDQVPVSKVDDKRTDVLPANEGKMTVAAYEYRLYLAKHMHPEFGVPFDVKNRLPAMVNALTLDAKGPTKGKPYVVCSELEDGQGGYVHTGINTVWEMEEAFISKALANAQRDPKLAAFLEKFKTT